MRLTSLPRGDHAVADCVIYIGLVAMVQQDMKKLVAYSSIAHMGFVTLGFFIFNELGISGGLVQMISTASCRARCS